MIMIQDYEYNDKTSKLPLQCDFLFTGWKSMLKYRTNTVILFVGSIKYVHFIYSNDRLIPHYKCDLIFDGDVRAC